MPFASRANARGRGRVVVGVGVGVGVQSGDKGLCFYEGIGHLPSCCS